MRTAVWTTPNGTRNHGRFFDNLRAVGIRGFIAEHTHDEDFTYPPETRAKLAEIREEGADETDE